MAALLSQDKGIGVAIEMPKSNKRRCNQTNSQHVDAMERYSDSMDDRETTCCFFAFQDTTEGPNRTQNPYIDRRVIGQDAQSI